MDAGDTSRESSNPNDAVLAGVSSVPVQPLFPQVNEGGLMQLQPAVTAPALVCHAPASRPSPPSNTHSGPPSNAPSEPVEDDLVQATIGPAIAQITNTYMPPPQFGQQVAQPASSRVAVSEVAAAAAAAPVPVAIAAVPPQTALATQSSGISAAAVGAALVPPVGEAALPPTEVNVAQHTRALEAAEVSGIAPPAQKVGRFSIKKRQDTMGTSDNGSAQTAGGMLHTSC